MTTSHYALEAMYLSLTGVCGWHAMRTNSLPAFALAGLYGFATEFIFYVAIERVAPRMYDHASDFLVMLPFGIPLYIPCLWLTFLYCSHKANVTFMTPKYRVFVPFIAAGFAMSLDLVAEPIDVRWGAWVYRPPVASKNMGKLGENWNGAPLINLAAWSGLQFGYSAALSLLPDERPLLLPVRLAIGVLLCLVFFAPFEVYRLYVSDYILVASLFSLSAVLMLFGTARSAKSKDKEEKANYWILASVAFVWNFAQIASLSLMPASVAFPEHITKELTILGTLSTLLFFSGGFEANVDWTSQKVKLS